MTPLMRSALPMDAPRSRSPLAAPRRALLKGVGALVLGVPTPGRPRAAQPAPPTLTGVVWQWQATVAPDGALLWQPDQPDRYTVTFLPDATLAIQADCNRARG